MSRLLLFSDLHLRPETEEVCFQVLDHVLEQAQGGTYNAVGFLGDFWHLRYQIPVFLLNRVAEWVQKITKEVDDLFILPGNHDQINVVGENALEIFAAHGARVYTDPTYNAWGGWMPYRKDQAEVKENLAWLRKESPQKVLFAHLPVRGAMMNNLVMDEAGLPTTVFKGWQRVILGHYHKRQAWLNGAMCYVGSPWQTRADEWGQPKGYAIWDAHHRDLEFVDTHWGPKHHRLEFPTLAQLATWWAQNPMLIKSQDHVKLTMPTETDAMTAAKWLHEQGVQKIVTAAKDVVVAQPRFAFKKGTTLTEYAHQYVLDNKTQDMDQNTLMHLWAKITEEQA